MVKIKVVSSTKDSVQLLSGAIEAIPAERLNPSDAERLAASLDASFEALRQIRRNLRREVSSLVAGGWSVGSL